MMYKPEPKINPKAGPCRNVQLQIISLGGPFFKNPVRCEYLRRLCKRDKEK